MHNETNPNFPATGSSSQQGAKRDGSLTQAQIDRAALIAESRSIDLETAQELVYLRDVVSATTSAAEGGPRWCLACGNPTNDPYCAECTPGSATAEDAARKAAREIARLPSTNFYENQSEQEEVITRIIQAPLP